MRRIGFPVWATILLLAAGVLFAVMGFRAMQLERERLAHWRMRAEQNHLRADAQRLMRAPRGRPLAEWRAEVALAEVEPRGQPVDYWPRIRRAAAHERDPNEALKHWEALRHATFPDWVRRVAALRSARLHLALSRPDTAEGLFSEAAGASTLLAAFGERVRAASLHALAVAGLRRGDDAGLERFLQEAEDGRRLVEGDVRGPDRLLIQLAGEVPSGQLVPPSPELATRLETAAAHARTGRALLAALGKHNQTIFRGNLGIRSPGGRVLLFPIESLIAEPPPGLAAAATCQVLPAKVDVPVGAVRLEAPLQSVVLQPITDPDDSVVFGAELTLVFGLLLYALGVAMALVGWRRSRRAAVREAEFTSAVSHEMKTPIASVRAMAELMGETAVEEPERARDYAGRIETEMHRLGATVRNVLDAAEIERGVMPVSLEPGDPATVVLSVGNAVRPLLRRRGFEVSIDALPAERDLAIDAAALEGVLMNLVDNAAKFSRDHKSVRLEGAPRPDGGYRIEVFDRGIGFDPRKQERLFDRFYRGRAARAGAAPGVGLGLHIARQVIEAHGGRISARIREGGGAAFEIDLPGKQPQ